RLFPDEDVDGPAFGGSLAFDANVVKIPHAPYGTKVALQGGLVIDITLPGVNPGFNGFCRNAAIASNVDGFDGLIGLGGGGDAAGRAEKKKAQNREGQR